MNGIDGDSALYTIECRALSARRASGARRVGVSSRVTSGAGRRAAQPVLEVYSLSNK